MASPPTNPPTCASSCSRRNSGGCCKSLVEGEGLPVIRGGIRPASAGFVGSWIGRKRLRAYVSVVMRASSAAAMSLREAGTGGCGEPIKRYLPWLVAVALFMENLDATILNTAVPTMSLALGVPPLDLKAVLTTYTLSLAVFIPVSGWMADRFGTR